MQKGTSMKGRRRKRQPQYRRAVQRNAIWVLSSGHGEFCLQHLSSIKRKRKTFIGGIGMGGFGALKCAAANPALFSAAVSISGITDLQWLMDHDPGRGEQFSAVFGGLQAMGENDLAGSFARLSGTAKGPKVLQIWLSTEERAAMNEKFREKMQGVYPCYEAREKRIQGIGTTLKALYAKQQTGCRFY